MTSFPSLPLTDPSLNFPFSPRSLQLWHLRIRCVRPPALFWLPAGLSGSPSPSHLHDQWFSLLSFAPQNRLEPSSKGSTPSPVHNLRKYCSNPSSTLVSLWIKRLLAKQFDLFSPPGWAWACRMDRPDRRWRSSCMASRWRIRNSTAGSVLPHTSKACRA